MIVFQKNLRSDRALPAYNNNIVEFTATRENAEPVYCDVIVNGQTQATIYPVGNKFWYNFKELASTLVNRNSFQDLTDINLVGSNPLSFVYDETPNAYIFTSIIFSVRYDDGQTENATRTTQFLRNVRKDKAEPVYMVGNVLTPNRTDAELNDIKYIGAYVKYWQGFPFDISILSRLGNPVEAEELSTILTTNTTNQLNHSFNATGQVNRLVFSDGRTDTTIELFLPLVMGMNRLLVNGFLLDVEKITDACGVYVKWLNPQGGWSYWLFTKFYEENVSMRSGGEINNDFNEIDETTSPTFDLGKDTEVAINVTTDNLTQQENSLFKTIFEASKVYLFTGKQYSKNTFNDWIEVRLRNTSQTTKNFKQDLTAYNLTIEKPKLNTMKL